MSTIRHEKIIAAKNRAYALVDYNIHNDVDKQYEFLQQIIHADKSLTEYEKSKAIKDLNMDYDLTKIIFNVGKERICESCQEECLATLYCEYCIRNYLKAKFSNWTSGNNDIDDLIQKCQMESLKSDKIIEWIPYNNLQDVKYLTKGGCSEIYTADWISGPYYEWNSEEQQLKRYGTLKVILKKLENVESANRSWFEESNSHLNISNKWGGIVKCYGLTQNQSNENYMLVMSRLDINLRKYLQQNHHQLTWKERIKIIDDISIALLRIHIENAIHRDLHSGNILYSQYHDHWFISDLGFCGPATKLLGSIYGNLSYIAPEVLSGKEYTFASDIYSLAMLMWEISSGQPPFIYKSDYNLAIRIVNGMRPKVVPGTPLEYKELMEQCWDADPTKRPSIQTIWEKIREINRYYQNESEVQQTDKSINTNNIQSIQSNINSSSTDSSVNSYYINTNSSIDSDPLFKNLISKIYNFKDLPEPRNATKEEQEEGNGYHNMQLDLSISENLSILNESDEEKNKSKRTYLDISDGKEKDFIIERKKLKLNNNEDNNPNFQDSVD